MKEPKIYIININVQNPELIESSVQLQEALEDLRSALQLLPDISHTHEYMLVEYIFCEKCERFFKLIGKGFTISIEQLKVTEQEFDNLYEVYNKYFVRFDQVTYRSFEPGELQVFQHAWELLFRYFIKPVIPSYHSAGYLDILFSIRAVRGKRYVYDFSTLFDLQFRFCALKANTPIYVLFVAGLSIVNFIKNLKDIIKPVPKNIILLYGFDKHYNEEALENIEPSLKELAHARGKLYEIMLSKAKAAGVTVIELQNKNDLLQCFKKEREGYLIQIISHYDTVEGQRRLSFKNTSIGFEAFERHVQNMGISNELRKDIIIDAITCTNFFDFQALYDLGIKYMYLSHHDLDTDHIAFVLHEMYSGINANTINWNFPYLDGIKYLHEVRSDVLRCFYTICGEGGLVLTP